MLFGVNPFVKLLQRSKVDVLFLDFLEQATQWLLPDAFYIHITMEMGCCIGPDSMAPQMARTNPKTPPVGCVL